MLDTKKLLPWVMRWPSVFGRSMVLSSRRLSASGWYTQRGQARKSAERLLQLVVLSFALAALLIDWTDVYRFAGEVEARFSRQAVAPSHHPWTAQTILGLFELFPHWCLRQ